MTVGRPLPPIPQPPHDPTSWLLNGRVGWHAAHLSSGLETTPDAEALQLAVAAGARRSPLEASGSFGGLTTPANVAIGPDGSVYLLDPATLRLKRFDPCTCRFEEVPCFGGEGSEARQLRAPHGIGICSGNLFVCDTGNQRVAVLALRGFVLRGHWRPSDAAVAAQWQPYDVTFDRRGHVYVTDPATGSIHRFSPTGRWLEPLTGLGAVRFIVSDCVDRLHVVRDGSPGDVVTLTPEGETVALPIHPTLAASLPPPPFQVDADGHMNLDPLCAPDDGCAPPTRAPAVFDLHGEHLSDPPALAPPSYEAEGIYYSEALDSRLYRCQWHRVVVRGSLPAGASLEVATYAAETELDDGRVQASGTEWETNVVLRSAERDAATTPAAVRDMLAARQDPACTRPAKEWDCLVRSGGGRYLWLRLILRGNGKVTPRLDSVTIEFPRISLRRYLPAVFGEEPTSADFTDRFLSLFDTTLRSVEARVDHVARYFDPLSAPAEPDPQAGTDFLSWLASWIGVSLDRHWPEAKRRTFLKRVGKLFDVRGTRYGLWRQLLLLLDLEPEGGLCCADDQPRLRCHPTPSNCAPPVVRPCAWQPPPLILEHYQLRRWLFVGAGRLGDEAVLWGQRIVNRSQLDDGARVGHTQLKTTQDPYRDPFHYYAHKFTVFVPVSYGECAAHRRALANLLRAESPAHTAYDVRYVAPRFRIGFQSMIGLDSVVARVPLGVTLRETPLGPASVLTGPPEKQGGPSMEIGRNARIGTTTQLN